MLTSVKQRRLRWVSILNIICVSFLGANFAVVTAKPVDEASDAVRQIVKARDEVLGYVRDVKTDKNLKPADIKEAKRLYRVALGNYNGWVASVKRAIRNGKLKDLQKDTGYQTASTEAGKSSKAFIDYVESKTGQSKGLFVVLGALADLGLKIWNAKKDRDASDRKLDADSFEKDCTWPQWEAIKAEG